MSHAPNMIKSASITYTEGVMSGDNFAIFCVSCLFFVARNMAGINKITERVLLVNSDNASRELNTGCLGSIGGCATARIKCLLFWHFVSIFLACTQFLSLGRFASNPEAASLGIMQDLSVDKHFSRGNIVDVGLRNMTVEIVLSVCVVLIRSGWGIVLNAAPLSCRETLNRLEFIFSKECFTVLGEVRAEVSDLGKADSSDLAFACKHFETLGVQVTSDQQSMLYVRKKGRYVNMSKAKYCNREKLGYLRW